MSAPKPRRDSETQPIHLEGGAPVRSTVIFVWLVVLFMTLYGAPAIVDEVGKNDVVGEWEWLSSLLVGVQKTSDAIGLELLREGADSVRQRINAPHTVLTRTETETPSAGPSDAAVIEPSDAGAPDAESLDAGPAPTLEHRRAPEKHRVLIVGASSIEYAMGAELKQRFPSYQGVEALKFGKLATGLSRPDYFDWPAKVAELSEKFHPDLIVANFGGNGAQDIPTGKYEKAKFGTEAWNTLYAKRVQELIELAKDHDADVVFMGMPVMRSPKFARKMKVLNAVQKEAAEAAGALWISTWDMAANPDGSYRDTITMRGKRGLMRMTDGVHYKKLGAEYVADNVLQEIERHFVLAPKDTSLAVAERNTVRSAILDRDLDYVAFVPQPKDAEPKVDRALIIFPPPSWQKWPGYPHRELQRLATEHELILLVIDELAPTDPSAGPVLTTELWTDLSEHLSIGSRRGLIGPDTEVLHEALDGAELAHSYQAVDEASFAEKLAELVAWHAAQLTDTAKD